MSILLIDGDIYIYRSAVKAETEVQWTEDLWTLHARMGDAINLFDTEIEKIKKATKAEDVIIALSDTTNFRYQILPTYKANRKNKRPPMLRGELKKYVQESYKTYLRPNLEADDVLGILATSTKIIKGDKIVVSVDKDVKTFPCTYYNSDKKTITETTKREAQYFHLYQTLIGDAVDGYSGCPSIGGKTAEKILDGMLEGKEDFQYWWNVVVSTYEKKGLTEEDALLQARVARICRTKEYNFKTKQVVLWTPEHEKD